MSDIKSINDLFGLNFVIPSYQRGYTDGIKHKLKIY